MILAPRASRRPDKPLSPLNWIERQVRRHMTGIVDREVTVLENSGKRVIRLEPEARDLQAFGFNMMDPARRQAVLDVALVTTRETVRRAIA